jgi:hypothetical protein
MLFEPDFTPVHSSQRESVIGDGAASGVSAIDTSLKMGARTSAVSASSARSQARGVAATAARMP